MYISQTDLQNYTGAWARFLEKKSKKNVASRVPHGFYPVPNPLSYSYSYFLSLTLLSLTSLLLTSLSLTFLSLTFLSLTSLSLTSLSLTLLSVLVPSFLVPNFLFANFLVPNFLICSCHRRTNSGRNKTTKNTFSLNWTKQTKNCSSSDTRRKNVMFRRRKLWLKVLRMMYTLLLCSGRKRS